MFVCEKKKRNGKKGRGGKELPSSMLLEIAYFIHLAMTAFRKRVRWLVQSISLPTRSDTDNDCDLIVAAHGDSGQAGGKAERI